MVLNQAIMSFFARLSHDRVAVVMLHYLFWVLMLNLIKYFLVSWSKKTEINNMPCIFLQKNKCTNTNYKERFHKHNNSCIDCPGKNIGWGKEESERRAYSAGIFNKWGIILANAGKTTLPYVAIVFTLLSRIMESKS
jgi:ABC-type glycerol-3-phosphate transport system permease component